VIRPVLLAEFGAEALEERAADPGWLEAVVRGHNDVIAAIHRVQAVLPARFGSVYADLEDLRAALEDGHDALQAHLRRLEGTDEWAIHVYAERPVVEQWAAAESPDVDRLQREIATARPGRAYFLQRKLADERAAAIDRAFSDLAQTAYDHLATYALAGQSNPLTRVTQRAKDEVEILRAAFLVPRAGVDTFLSEVRALGDRKAGLDADYSGPWPPYSFAERMEELP
jgi:hypothetical protein